ncbi:MAG: anti-repressor SinI family protein [Bacillus sp. (in: firmicutes)]
MLHPFVNKKDLDKEWVELIQEAQTIGIPIDVIRDFLHQSPRTAQTNIPE